VDYSINPAVWSRAFPIPCDITDKHIKMCSGVALKCLLLILRSPDEYGSIEALAKKLGQPNSEIADALNYWKEQGIIFKAESGAIPILKAVEKAEPAAPVIKPAAAEPVISTTAAVAPRPRFPRDEALALINDDATLHSLQAELQAVLGKPLTSADNDVLVALYSFYGLSAHYILSLVHYCTAIGKRGMAYAEKVAVSWINDGIDERNVDTHIDKLYNRRTNEGIVRHTFGIKDRNLTSKEKDYISSWFDLMGFDISIIQYAYEITVDRTGKTAFGYINKILSDWCSKGVKTLADAKNEAASRTIENSASNTPIAAASDDRDQKILEQFMKN